MSTSACVYMRIWYQSVGKLGKETTRLGSLGARMVVLAGRSPIGRENTVSELCRELGIRPVTLYRYVGPQGQLREQGEKVLAT